MYQTPAAHDVDGEQLGFGQGFAQRLIPGLEVHQLDTDEVWSLHRLIPDLVYVLLLILSLIMVSVHLNAYRKDPNSKLSKQTLRIIVILLSITTTMGLIELLFIGSHRYSVFGHNFLDYLWWILYSIPWLNPKQNSIDLYKLDIAFIVLTVLELLVRLRYAAMSTNSHILIINGTPIGIYRNGTNTLVHPFSSLYAMQFNEQPHQHPQP